jgi:AhpD family alkylhydroperoxidase
MTTATETMTARMSIVREAPELYRAMIAFDNAETGLDPVLRELVKIRVSQVNGCAFCIDMHTKDARAAGESEHRLYALTAWRETPFFTPRERAALALAEAATRLADGPVPDDVYDEAARHFSSGELAQLIWRITIMNAWNRIGVTTRMVPGEYQPARG